MHFAVGGSAHRPRKYATGRTAVSWGVGAISPAMFMGGANPVHSAAALLAGLVASPQSARP
jgi:hypothetical protein